MSNVREMSSYTERFAASIEDAAAPLREQEAELSEKIGKLEEELRELKPIQAEMRRRLRGLLGDGEFAPRKNGKPGPKPKPPGRVTSSSGKVKGMSEEKLTAVLEWCEAHRDEWPDGFLGGQVIRDGSFPIKYQSGAAAAFRIFHDRGLMTLTKVGAGGRKFYKLVA